MRGGGDKEPIERPPGDGGIIQLPDSSSLKRFAGATSVVVALEEPVVVVKVTGAPFGSELESSVPFGELKHGLGSRGSTFTMFGRFGDNDPGDEEDEEEEPCEYRFI